MVFHSSFSYKYKTSINKSNLGSPGPRSGIAASFFSPIILTGGSYSWDTSTDLEGVDILLVTFELTSIKYS